MTNMTYAQALNFATEIIANGTANFNGFSANDYLEKLETLKTQLVKHDSPKTREITKEKREVRAKEIETAFKEVDVAKLKANKLLKEFVKDYGYFQTYLLLFG